jgi:hypothetical protein
MKMMGLKKGQALVEFAIILPIFLYMVIIVFDFGRAMLDYSILNTAVREGTRMAVVGSSEADINSRISDICGALEGFDIGGVVYYSAGSIDDPKIGIAITYNYPPIAPGMELLIGKIPLHAQSEMYLTPFAQ